MGKRCYLMFSRQMLSLHRDKRIPCMHCMYALYACMSKHHQNTNQSGLYSKNRRQRRDPKFQFASISWLLTSSFRSRSKSTFGSAFVNASVFFGVDKRDINMLRFQSMFHKLVFDI
jgi:hypothetical protein